ncbi:MAG: allophanate hydrolase [Solirubrobacterales bacterium]|nr:allophanate hydrolase [Solirubrobacterales bacterium]
MSAPSTAATAVAAAYERIAASGRPEVWITLRERTAAFDAAAEVDTRLALGADLPLAGRTLAVKDNIDVAGLPTTAGCPAFAFVPAVSATAVARLEAAGAVVIGKTNLDQFATGLVGTRSPYGAVRDAWRPQFVSGGSSSGSGVAVALGLVDLALGTDTAGSGRVPAAFGGTVGLKPTIGRVPVTGVLPACRSFDCVTVFARAVDLADEACELMAGVDPADPLTRAWPVDAPLGAPPVPVVGRPASRALEDLTDDALTAFEAAAAALASAGVDVVEVDVDAYLEAGRLLYDGAFVAERHAAVGAFVEAHAEDVDPTVGAIIRAAGTLSASALTRDRERLDALAARVDAVLRTVDVVLLPTTTRQPTLAEVAADPVAANTRLGIYTNGTNLCDLAAIAVPAGEADGGRFGVTLIAPAFHDRVVADLARRLLGEPPRAARPQTPGIDLFVVGAHRAGQPLHHELAERGARYVDTVRTLPSYRLHRLATTPPKPGLVRVSAAEGTAVEGERWRLPVAALATFLAALPSPMALGSVALEDGASCVGFLCEPLAAAGTEDVSAFGSWPAYLAAVAGD